MISIIIVNYNTSKVLNDCIESIFRYEKPEDLEIIIVDNASEDNSQDIIELIEKKYRNVRCILLEKRVSFSAANNRGIESAAGEYIIIMNPDILFTEPLIEKIIDDFETDSSIGALTPALMGINGNFQRNYFQRYPTLIQFLLFQTLYAKLFFRFPKLMNKWLENQDVDVSNKKLWNVEQIPCAFFMTRRNIITRIGMMDEKFALFFEDVDLSCRIHKNYKLAVDTALRVTHLGGSSFNAETNWWMQGRFIASMHYYFKKHYGSFSAFLLKAFAVSNSITILAFEYLKKIFGKADEFRVKKHKNVLKLLKE